MTQKLLKKLIIGFGFFNGLWFSLGMDPEQEIMMFLQPILSELHPWLKALFIILPTIILIVSIVTVIKIYHTGGMLGAGAVALAFLAGALILTQWIMALIILIIAILTGILSVNK